MDNNSPNSTSAALAKTLAQFVASFTAKSKHWFFMLSWFFTQKAIEIRGTTIVFEILSITLPSSGVSYAIFNSIICEVLYPTNSLAISPIFLKLLYSCLT